MQQPNDVEYLKKRVSRLENQNAALTHHLIQALEMISAIAQPWQHDQRDRACRVVATLRSLKQPVNH
jgi:hypothetical protein